MTTGTLPARPAYRRVLRWRPWLMLGLLAGFVLLPMVVAEYNAFVLAMAGTMLLPAVGLNLLKGYAGPISVGHGALMAVGGYTAALLMVDHGVSFWLAAPAGMVLTGLVGAIVALPSFRISAWYFALLTLTLGMAIQRLLSEASSITKGNAGVIGITPPSVFGTVLGTSGMYYLVLAVNVLAFVLLRNLVASRTGRAMQAIRDAPPVARSAGVSVGWTTVSAFIVSAAYAGVGGALFAVLKLVITPDDFGVHLSITLLIYVVLGGLGQLWGPVVGVAVFYWLPQMFPELASWRAAALGVVVLVVTALTPNGIVGVADTVRGRLAGWLRRGRRSGRAAPAPAAAPVSPAPAASPGPTAVPASAAGAPAPAGAAPAVAAAPAAPQLARPPEALHIDAVTKRFAGVVALDRVTIHAAAGEIHGLVGSNGSGKTTLLNLISGVYRPDEGTIRLGERDITKSAQHRIARAGVGRTFQTPTVLQRLTVLDNVLLGAHSRARAHALQEVLRTPGARRDDRRLRDEAVTWLHFVGLADQAGQQASVLPHGQLRLLEIARAMLLEPTVLLLDEPAAGLSLRELERLSQTIDAIRGLGVTVLLVEHHLDMVAGIATSVTALDQGKVIAQGTPAEVFSSPQARGAYMGAGQ